MSKCIDKPSNILLSSEHICRHLDKGWSRIHELKREKIKQLNTTCTNTRNSQKINEILRRSKTKYTDKKYSQIHEILTFINVMSNQVAQSCPLPFCNANGKK